MLQACAQAVDFKVGHHFGEGQRFDRVGSGQFPPQHLSLAKTLGVLSFTPLTMLQACAQAVDFKVGHHFGEGQVQISSWNGHLVFYPKRKTFRFIAARTAYT
jgi:hypothetical protein